LGLQDGIALVLAGACALFIARKFLAPIFTSQKSGACQSQCGCADESPRGNPDMQSDTQP